MNYKDLLKKNDLRITKQRNLILDFINQTNKPVSGQEIYDSLREKMKIDLSTIYRNLNTLEEYNILLKTADIDGINYYQINNDDHKHFISCSVCHRKFIIENCPVHELEENLMAETGFIINGHNFEFYGICPDCQEKTSEKNS